MAKAEVKLTLTTTEFDLVREAVHDFFGKNKAIALDRELEDKKRREHRAKAVQLEDLERLIAG